MPTLRGPPACQTATMFRAGIRQCPSDQSDHGLTELGYRGSGQDRRRSPDHRLPIENRPAGGLGRDDRLALVQPSAGLGDECQQVLSLNVRQAQIEIEMKVCPNDGMHAQIRYKVRQP
jgi:hypothetical protein